MNLLENKCKNCGASLDLNSAVNGVIHCTYCGSTFTVSKRDTSPDALSAIRLGEHELSVCAFDRAYEAFSRAAQIDTTEPEAFFGMALAEFKVQYVKDIDHNRLQPLCHEISDKIFTRNSNYRIALSLASPEQCAEYERKAQEINYIRDEFLAIKEAGTSYDCFICVKITDKNTGGRTADYYIANELYTNLKDKGYHPFFSQPIMKNKSGSAYEAHILYALKSAECMLIVCSNEEYLNETWVKNEYCRFYEMMNADEKDKDSVAIVFDGKPIEKLPIINKKLQGIDYCGNDAYVRIYDFVDKHTPEAKARKAEAIRKQTEAENKQKEQLASIQAELLRLKEDAARAERARIESERKRQDEFRQFAVQAQASAMHQAPISEFEIENGVLIKYNGSSEKVEVPNGVTEIGRSAFEKNKTITSITFPASVKVIGSRAFMSCERLTNVIHYNSIKLIKDSAFQDCGFTYFKIPDSVIKIETKAFWSSNLQTVIIGSGVTEIQSQAIVGWLMNSVTFMQPNKWAVYDGLKKNKLYDVSAAELSIPGRAAKLLNYDYKKYTWIRG